MLLRGARSVDGALGLVRALGYDTTVGRPYDLGDVGLSGVGTRLRAHQTRGYGLLVAEVDELPRSFKTIGRRLVDRFHDEPLVVLGVRGTGSCGNRSVPRVAGRPCYHLQIPATWKAASPARIVVSSGVKAPASEATSMARRTARDYAANLEVLLGGGTPQWIPFTLNVGAINGLGPTMDLFRRQAGSRDN